MLKYEYVYEKKIYTRLKLLFKETATTVPKNEIVVLPYSFNFHIKHCQ